MFGLLGFEAFDLIAEILAHRRVIREPSGFDIYTGVGGGEPGEVRAQIPHFKQERAPTIATQVECNILCTFRYRQHIIS